MGRLSPVVTDHDNAATLTVAVYTAYSINYERVSRLKGP